MGYEKFHASQKGTSVQAGLAAEQLCTYCQHAITAALGLDQQSQTPLIRQKESLQAKTSASTVEQRQGQAAGQPVQTDKPSQASPRPVQSLVAPTANFVVAVAASASRGLQAAALLRVLKLAQSLVDAMQQQGCETAAELVEMMMNSDSAVAELRYSFPSQNCLNTSGFDQHGSFEAVKLQAAVFLDICPPTPSSLLISCIPPHLHTEDTLSVAGDGHTVSDLC